MLDPCNWRANGFIQEGSIFIYLEIITEVTQVLKDTFVSMEVRARVRVNLSVSRSVSCFCKASTFPSSSILMSLSDWSLCLLCCSEFCSLQGTTTTTTTTRKEQDELAAHPNSTWIYGVCAPLLHLHHGLLHFLHLLLQLLGLGLFFLGLPLRVLQQQ